MDHFRLRDPGTYVGPVVASIVVLIAVLVALSPAGPSLPGGAAAGDSRTARPADWTPSYSQDIEPVFSRVCFRCHGPQRADKGLRLDSYQRTMAGDSYGTVVIPGDSSLSTIVSVVKYGTMPHDGTKLTPAEIDTISRWIDGGAVDN